MKTLLSFVFAGALVLAAGCSSVDSRIARNRVEFESWPFAVQQKVASGQVDIGFTPEQVQMALGNPDRIVTRTTNDGASQAWVYRNRSPRFGFGLGFGMIRGSSAFGAGVSTGDWPREPDESLRVMFEGGRVSAIESAGKR
jgi:hypothetical protein